jgi:phage terminase Nu1 subunit (DNA packaging protein)
MKTVTRKAFADLMQVHPATVTKWAAAERIVLVGDKVAVEESRSLLAATENLEPQAQAQIDRHAAERAEKADAGQGRQEMPPMEKLGAALKLEVYKGKRLDNEIAALKIDEIAGALTPVADANYTIQSLGISLRTLLDSLPDRLAPAVVACRGDVTVVHETLREAFDGVLNNLAEIVLRLEKK